MDAIHMTYASSHTHAPARCTVCHKGPQGSRKKPHNRNMQAHRMSILPETIACCMQLKGICLHHV